MLIFVSFKFLLSHLKILNGDKDEFFFAVASASSSVAVVLLFRFFLLEGKINKVVPHERESERYIKYREKESESGMTGPKASTQKINVLTSYHPSSHSNP